MYSKSFPKTAIGLAVLAVCNVLISSCVGPLSDSTTELDDLEIATSGQGPIFIDFTEKQG